MREYNSKNPDLNGCLLLSHPGLQESIFRRATVFISAHDRQEGAFGLIINKPANKTVSNLLPEKDLGLLSRIPVFIGGPVGCEQLIFASFQWNPETHEMSCETHLLIDQAMAAIEEGLSSVRAFVGYSGWSGGQLEGELNRKAWIVQDPSKELLSIEAAKESWMTIMKSLGPWYSLMAGVPDDLSRN